MIKKIIVSILLLFVINNFSQTNDINDVQYGFAVKATIDFNAFKSILNNGNYSNINISAFGGVGAHLFDITAVYPSLHAGVVMYNRGELISSYKNKFSHFTFDFMLDLTVNLGIYRNTINFDRRNVPLYHFSDFTVNPLQNPFQHSLYLGTNIIWSTEREMQRVGLIGIMIDRHFQFSTYNDSTVFSQYLADGKDRYYTGGAMFGYHVDKNKYNFDLLEFSFHKFTGYEKDTFETAILLQIDFIPYKKKETYYYNKNRLRFTATNTVANYGVHLSAHNTDFDLQDYLHYNGNYAYHPDIFLNQKGFWNEIKQMSIGGSWLTNSHKFTN